uniref:DNA oxidative demethylase ALKBH2 n=1 Tax=Xiphophorus maculatus TaxID=8083 RepID=A0A3B5Q4E6_XIPMA
MKYYKIAPGNKKHKGFSENNITQDQQTFVDRHRDSTRAKRSPSVCRHIRLQKWTSFCLGDRINICATMMSHEEVPAEGLDCDYALLFLKGEADNLFRQLEEEVVYSTGEEAKVQVFGKVYNIPRKQATYGNAGLTYTYSGVRRLASPWTPTLEYIRNAVTGATGQKFNFVLINRYKDGQDHMGEHRDDEKELDPSCPIASVSLGAARDFVFRHRDARGKRSSRQIDPVKLELAHGSLLLMNPPTNTFWYHSLPVRKKVLSPRINLTFRRILEDVTKQSKRNINSKNPD